MEKIDKKRCLLTKPAIDQADDSRLNDEYSVTIARSVQDIEKIRNIWEKMQPYPVASVDYYLTIVNSREEVVQPHLILLSRNNSPQAMLVGRIEEASLEFKFGHRVLFRPKVRSLTVVEGGILGNTSKANCTALVSQLIESLKRREADVVAFHEIPTESYIYQLAKTSPGFLTRDHFPIEVLHYRMTLPASLDEFYARKNKKRRKYLRRIVRRLDREFSGNVSVKCFRQTGDVEQLCRDAEKISKKTYQYALGSGFLNNRQTRQLTSLLAGQGLLLAFILYINDEPCAFEGGVVYENTYYSDYCGYDPQYSHYEIGTVLQLKIIEDLAIADHIKFIDFGPGDSWYKRSFCDLNWKEGSFYIFQPSFKGIRLNALKALTGTAHQLGNVLLAWLNLKEKWERFKRNQFKQKLENA